MKHLLSFSGGAEASAGDVVNWSKSDGVAVPGTARVDSGSKMRSMGDQPRSNDCELSLLDCEAPDGSGTSAPSASFPTKHAQAASDPGAIRHQPKEIVRWRTIGAARLRREGALERKTKQQGDGPSKLTITSNSLPGETLQESLLPSTTGLSESAEQKIYPIAAEKISGLQTSPYSSVGVEVGVETTARDRCPFSGDRRLPQRQSALAEGGKTLMKPERKGQTDPAPEAKLQASIFAVPESEEGAGSVAKGVSEITTLPSSRKSSTHSNAGGVPVAPDNDSRSAEVQVARSIMRQLSATDRPSMESGADSIQSSAGIRRRENESSRPDHQREISASGRLQMTDVCQETRLQPEARAHLALADRPFAASTESSASQHFPNEARQIPGEALSTIEAQMNTAPDMRWTHASAHRAEAGFDDPTLGWVSVRAHADSQGVHATVVPDSPEAARVLGEHLGALNAHLADRYLHAPAITLANPETGWTGQSSHQGMQQENRDSNHESLPSDCAGDPLRSVRPSSSTQTVSDDAGEHGHNWRLPPIDWGGIHVSLLA